MKIRKFLSKNKEWIFSGMGVALFGWIITFSSDILHKEKRILPTIRKKAYSTTTGFEFVIENQDLKPYLITKIDIKKIKDLDVSSQPLLRTSAQYEFYADSIPVGGSTTISVSHLLKAQDFDKIAIFPHSSKFCSFEFRLTTADGAIFSTTASSIPENVSPP